MVGLTQIRLLTLEKNVHSFDVLYKLDRGFHLHLIPGKTLQGVPLTVYSNHPSSSNSGAPRRNTFHRLTLRHYGNNLLDDTDLRAEIVLRHSGPFSFCYFSEKRDEETLEIDDPKKSTAGSGCFVVAPTLKFGPKDDPTLLRLDAVSSQTYIAKLLGPLATWWDTLRVAKESGYKMIHLTPIQELAASNSAYSLKDHLRLNPRFGEGATYADVAAFTKRALEEWNVFVVQDVVLNHTGNETPWLRHHPECLYNLVNSPHLKPAYVMDRIIAQLTRETSGDGTENAGVLTEADLAKLESRLVSLVEEAKLEEFFLVEADAAAEKFRSSLIEANERREPRSDFVADAPSLVVISCKSGDRLSARVNPDPLLPYFLWRLDSGATLDDCVFQFSQLVAKHNGKKKEEVKRHLGVAVENVMNNVRYRFIDPKGPKYPRVSEKNPLMLGYFYNDNLETLATAAEEERLNLSNPSSAALIWAHNGWVFGGDSLQNFAEGGQVYLRRELVPWGDSVKINYGRKYEDNPYVWDAMRDYVINVAESFHGIRLDNCHSTPLHVAEYMLAAAREVNPNLYVMAELFTGSESKDNVFINRLGINSLVREANSAKKPFDLGAMIHRYSNDPVGAFFQPEKLPLCPSIAAGLLYDQTHDNPSLAEIRTLLDFLPTAAIVSMGDSAVGSSRGFDELFMHHVNVVNETRSYKSFSSKTSPSTVTSETGIIRVKKMLNKLHAEMARTGFNELYVDQIDESVVAITRHNPRSHQTIVLVAYSAFSAATDKKFFKPLKLNGVVLDEILFEASLDVSNASGGSADPRDGEFLEPTSGCRLYFKENFPVYESNFVEANQDLQFTPPRFDDGEPSSAASIEIDFVNFRPGNVIAFRFSLNNETKSNVLTLRTSLSQFGYSLKTCSGRSLSALKQNNLETIIADLSLADFNYALFRCNDEERAAGIGGVYDIPGHGPLIYAGLQGIVNLLDKARPQKDLGHSLFNNLREGDWLLDYTAARLSRNPGTKKLGLWFQEVFRYLAKIPRHLIPCYFDAIVSGVHDMILDEIFSRMGVFVSEGSQFVKDLALASVQLVGCSRIYQMPPVPSPYVPVTVDPNSGRRVQAIPSMAAGLPHFSAGIFRSWGRDTFISLRGLLLLPRRLEEAQWIILSYASAMRHGLIPNLLGEGIGARYNCRDAVWWWLQSVKDYCLQSCSTSILESSVYVLFTTDESQARLEDESTSRPLRDLIHETLEHHWRGISFRERNAGPSIDNHMTDAGFNVEVKVDRATGFVSGGNSSNCGTWMDKMSQNGKPATPRDGAAVEIVALSYSVLSWLASLPKEAFPFGSIRAGEEEITLADWANLIKENFQREFWIPGEAKSNGRSGFYRDSVLSSSPRREMQLRPNFLPAMVVAPGLFDRDCGRIALKTARQVLAGPVGVKTLDPDDPDYNGFYVDGSDNYHQGPEWLWPTGFFLRALLMFSEDSDLTENLNYVKAFLARLQSTIKENEWRGLPELTNCGGAVCPGSCMVQAWSHATILELMHDLYEMGK